ncbi:homeobox protein 2 isoform X2 [Arachis ipaensis]|uniref:homeobox protein 2 isoform X2 n=2 Tax=Arachis ipaensis TaxID=130454 RepID=UPI000A2B155A|nr:homeobox protein 2 isoform X2 [Arachis ipaensis]XP_020962268.1 homeobox protein 2 isoform X2 [Arachis ipaensis]XP_020962269.1 homeobox protein 2 isoform X2 [Arachis ipaensis]XP_020962270.1 homeobox protein 2 isoform X2 [Arachis ipaensis]XP_020962271.1 homeobox protein 2 isoform X2 [Arachis ipaensis]XP_025669106.1 homeobox protein 2 isoform X2 [Arachis hypogaea]XP_025669107.1 homeobox protein 2 isoform X2 [Arachis hypogaea]
MDKESSSVVRSSNNVNGGGGEGSLVLRASSDGTRHTTTPDLVLQWGNRKRLRCMKVQVKDKDKDDSSAPVQRTTVRVDRRVVRTDKDSLNKPPLGLNNNNITLANNNHNHHQTNGYPNLRQRPSSPQQRILRNSETSSAMRGVVGGQSNGGVRGIASPDRGAHDKRGTHNNNNHHHHHHHNDNNKSAASSDTAHDSKKGGSPSGSGDAVPQVWPPKFVIALTNKEKEEDFFAIKGTKLPQRPKKRAKFIQRTLNEVDLLLNKEEDGIIICKNCHLVSPGAWLSDLTLERYEVREKKISKKRPRGLKAMNNVESDSE